MLISPIQRIFPFFFWTFQSHWNIGATSITFAIIGNVNVCVCLWSNGSDGFYGVMPWVSLDLFHFIRFFFFFFFFSWGDFEVNFVIWKSLVCRLRFQLWLQFDIGKAISVHSMPSKATDSLRCINVFKSSLIN